MFDLIMDWLILLFGLLSLLIFYKLVVKNHIDLTKTLYKEQKSTIQSPSLASKNIHTLPDETIDEARLILKLQMSHMQEQLLSIVSGLQRKQEIPKSKISSDLSENDIEEALAVKVAVSESLQRNEVQDSELSRVIRAMRNVHREGI